MEHDIKENGYGVIKDVVTESFHSKINTLANMYIERCMKRQGYTGNIGYRLFRTENIVRDFPLPQLLTLNPVYQILTDILGTDFHLIEMVIHFSQKGNQRQELHSDVLQLFPEQKVQTPPFLVAVHYPLQKFNFCSGGTRIIKKTQNLNLVDPTSYEDESIDQIKQSTPSVTKRDCFIRDCRNWHGAGENKTEDIRAMYSLAFAKNWFKRPAIVSKEFFYSLDQQHRHMVTT